MVLDVVAEVPEPGARSSRWNHGRTLMMGLIRRSSTFTLTTG